VGSSLPGYAAFATTGNGPFVHTSEVNALSPLQKPGGGTIAAEYYDPSGFNVTLSLTDGQTHVVAIYMADYDGQNRTESVQAFAGNSPLTSPVTISNFTGGDYVVFDVSGSVTFTFTHLGGGSAVFDGLFVGAPTTPTASPAATLTPAATTAVKTPTPTPTLTGTALTISAGAGKALTNVTLGSFVSTSRLVTPPSFTALIHWGDSSVASKATVVYNPSTRRFSILGSHKYAPKGKYRIVIDVLGIDGSKLELSGLANIT
jgi:hypothetical protein